MHEMMKAASVERQSVSAEELASINRQTLRELSAEEVFPFRLAACDNQIDRDYERFTDAALEGFAPLFVGKTVLLDHQWSASSQTARVYAAAVEQRGDVKRLILRCYMLRTSQSAGTIAAIEGGILRECSVGCTVERVRCSICGADQTQGCCEHVPGQTYHGQLCVMELDGAKDAYEVSLVAVPAQPGAGIVKQKRYGAHGDDQRMAEAMQRQEEQRYGGWTR